MNYELAKKLKEQGFPQTFNSPYTATEIANQRYANDVDKLGRKILLPTLSELITACGEKFLGLQRLYTGWAAVSYPFSEYIEQLHEGQTPEIAVAKLWLALQERKAND